MTETKSLSPLYQDSNWIAVNKPAGISVHNNEDPQNLLSLLAKEQGLAKLYPVHRLDKETSGIQVLALNESWAQKLALEFQNRQVRKLYVGILRGPLKNPQGVWTQPLTDKAEGRKNPSGMSRDRVPCETRFRTLKESKYFTLCEFDLVTGRQHQIRKHAALTNHPIVGDPRYGDKTYNDKMEKLYQTARLFLHCMHVEIAGHPLDCPVPPVFEALFV